MDDKEELQNQKLKLEIADLKKVWWKRPQFFTVCVPPLIISISTLFGLYLSGVFDRQKTELNKQVNSLTLTRDSLEIYVENLNDSIKDLSLNVSNLKYQYTIENKKYTEAICNKYEKEFIRREPYIMGESLKEVDPTYELYDFLLKKDNNKFLQNLKNSKDFEAFIISNDMKYVLLTKKLCTNVILDPAANYTTTMKTYLSCLSENGKFHMKFSRGIKLFDIGSDYFYRYTSSNIELDSSSATLFNKSFLRLKNL